LVAHPNCAHLCKIRCPSTACSDLSLAWSSGKPRWKGRPMNDLLAHAIAAHGSIERWTFFNRVTITFVHGGQLYAIKGVQVDDMPRKLTASLHEEWVSIFPFGAPDWSMAFTPDRIAIETRAGAIIAERVDPRASFAGHGMDTAWDPLQ